MGASKVCKLKLSSTVESNTCVDPAGGDMVHHNIADLLHSPKQDYFLTELAL